MATRQTRSSAAKAAAIPVQASSEIKPPVSPASVGKKRKRATTPVVEDPDELPHGLGKPLLANRGQVEDEETDSEEPASKKRATSITPSKPISKSKANSIIAKATAKAASTKNTTPKKKNYGHTPGKSPFADWPHPTAEECQVVHDLLTEVHGLHSPPKTIPAPSSTVAGCGEVPSILDALIRTMLSASTSATNAAIAIKGIHKTFSKLSEGTGKGSPDYNEIRLADISVLLGAIESGGLGPTKSKNIKAVLDMVYEENEAHRAAYKKRKETGNTDAVETADGTITLEKSAELTCANPDILTLDHMHALSDKEAFDTFLTYPGIGVKTAACVLLFCMKRHSFAVDTHVFRLSKWLGWVPQNANRDKTFSHLEVMIPDNLKYGLHQLFIKHGKSCGRCEAKFREGSWEWAKGCVIDHLVERTKTEKGGKEVAVRNRKKASGKKGKGKQKVIVSEGEDEDTDSEDR